VKFMDDKIDTEIRHITPAGSNIYADLGFDKAEAEQMLAKAKLAVAVTNTIKSRQLSQEQAAKLLGMAPSELSDILRGQFRSIGEDQMREYLTKLEQYPL